VNNGEVNRSKMSDAPAFLSLAEYSRRCGVTRGAVTGWKRRGFLVMTADGKVDVAASGARLSARPSISRGGKTKFRGGQPIEGGTGAVVEQSVDVANPATWSRQEALRQREIAQARLAHIEADRAAGLVVPRADIAGAVRAEYGIVRTAFLGMAAKLAHRLAAATTPEACGALVDTEVRAILDALTADGAP
jgi:hypothetical protein